MEPLVERALALAETIGVRLLEPQAEQLVAQLELLEAWNRTHNLVGPGNPRGWLERHSIDSLALAPLLSGAGVDVGSGAGFPGIPIAIARPDLQLTLIEPRQKRVAFLRHLVSRLGLANVRIRADRLAPNESGSADFGVSRAAFPWPEWLERGGRLLRSGGLLVVELGLAPPAERAIAAAAGPAGLRFSRLVSYRAGAQPMRSLALLTREG
ncbi:MAG: 16S rRNA (guanine(527)-N(7))-methyltransferase RsmG [Deltaproteobacteria bacterium]